MTAPFKSVADWWKDYSSHVMPGGATVEQVRDMKRAFHAGVNVALVSFMRISDLPTQDMIETRWATFHAEGQEFAKAVREGRA